ncbi:phage integrase family protein [Clostridioides difficile 824]|uniref:tyrosine-type recombinase/integrase n=1 Tax=Clostridioides difficile TaxID=1496 RepID=UPI00038C9B1E|nr:site-specific integrase [Clostridioides difficile]OFU38425.1 integrase [Clostridium sp. HMSC19A11]OFU38622.1 integrase [Clostridium sp. HMSC19B04]AXU62232.1 phage integrase [Clostridioides difficile]EGT4720815.1 site-specific integrase [Clostridioides difficile]EQE55906.1 phage integrase family protein [Clostridioides difficile CD44]
MATKRANGEGSIGKYKDGWRSRIMIGYNEDGKPIRKEFYGKIQKEVKDKLDAYKKQYYLSSDISDDKITLEHWFYNWLFEYRIKDLKPKSFERYESIYRNYIKDTDLGNVKLKDLRVSHIQKYYNRLLDSNKSIPTIRQINTKLKTCLSEAEKQGLIQRNYCTMVNIPVEKKENKLEILTLEQQKSFIKVIDGHKLEVLFLLALGTGLRLGELLGLKWFDIDFKKSNLTVKRTLQRTYFIDKTGNRELKVLEQEPKTSNSYRTVPIPKDVLNKLKEHKVNQNTDILKAGELYRNDNYVFCNELGIPIDDKRPLRNLKSILNSLDIEPIKFHGLRKTYATRLFENDVPPKTVQVLMGHYDISITLNIYTQVMEDKKVEAVEKLDKIFSL